MPTDRSHICIIGAGAMGRGIAQVAVGAGHRVSLVDPDLAQLSAAVADITRRLGKRDPTSADTVAGLLITSPTVDGVEPEPATIVIEAIFEQLEAKRSALNAAWRRFGASAIFATNTSSLSVTEIAAAIEEPSRVVGMHFFNPVPAMKLVEVVSGLQTDPAVADAIDALAASWGKTVARVRSTPGFIVNRVARSFYGEALKLVEEGTTSFEVVDELMRSAGGFRMGPFELMDLIGVEVNLAVSRSVWQAYNYDPRFAPSLIQTDLVSAGRLGRKSGQGFYRYGEGVERPTPEPTISDETALNTVELLGDNSQLEALVLRSGVGTTRSRSADGTAWIELEGAGAVVVTCGLTAQQESVARGTPVAVVDRCLEPDRASALALSASNDEIAAAAISLLAKAGVRAYRTADTPGLVVCRILSMIASEAWETVHHGVASRDDIDAAMVFGTNYPVGPFRWCAAWGSANVLAVLDNLWADYHDPRYRASRLLRSVAQAQTAARVAQVG